ncbi:hypothetical protein [Lactobacillus crispatus]|uniref:hypothetical protein n=1 Tax=Lactobacillus crispatus TaxID=47770 RepID=UPI0028048DA8|nr:hypothetical protein [uncultured Lactobacillus sp.]
MGLFDWLIGKKETGTNEISLSSNNKNRVKNANRKQFTSLLKKFYQSQNYENIPYIESEESAKFVWENSQGSISLAVLVPKEYMENIKINNENYTFGDIVLLWWLSSRKNTSNIPHYFARNYGINTEESINKMIDYGLLNQNKKPTEEGLCVIKKYNSIIKKHRSKKSWSGTGPVKYDYSPTLKGEAKKKEMLKHVLKQFDDEIQFYKESKIHHFQWMTAKDPCPVCKRLQEQNTGLGKGIYRTSDYRKIRKYIHYDCRCTTTPYDKNLPDIL